MIKPLELKPIIIDREKNLMDLNNWELITEDWGHLDYDTDGSCVYEDIELEWVVGDETIITYIEIVHSYHECRDDGDYWTPPSVEIYDEEVDVYVTSMYSGDTGEEFNIDDKFIYRSLGERLGFYIQDTYYG